MIKLEDKIAQRILAFAVGLSLVLFATSLLVSTIDVVKSSTTISEETTNGVLLGTDNDYAYYSYIDAIGQVQYSKIAVNKLKPNNLNKNSIFSGHLNGWNN